MEGMDAPMFIAIWIVMNVAAIVLIVYGALLIFPECYPR